MWVNCEESKEVVKSETIKGKWEVEQNKCVDEGCPEVENEIKVAVSIKAYSQIKTLCRMYSNLEWMAGLVGKEVKNDDEISIYVEKIKLFEQVVGGATVELTNKGNEEIAKQRLLGWIHSHNTMSVFLSNTDVSTANFTTLSLVVNNDLEFEGKIRLKLGCGRFGLIDVEVGIEATEDKEIVEQAKKLISTKKIEETKIVSYNENNVCLRCGMKVGNKNKSQVGGIGVVHTKCYDNYLKEFEELAIEDRISQSVDEYIIYDEMGNAWCRKCHQKYGWCECSRNEY